LSGDLYVGGTFGVAGNRVSGFIGRYGELADLTVSVSSGPSPVLVGASLTYTAVVSNLGPATALGVVLTETLPLSGTLGATLASQGSCSGSGPVVCGLGVLSVGGQVTVSTELAATGSGLATLSGSVSSLQVDPVSTNNAASASIQVTTPPGGETFLPLSLVSYQAGW
jgi:uncharacterized repeat protein (TIGR01451 family)